MTTTRKKTLKFFTNGILNEAKRILKDGDSYEPCEPNCIRCLCAVAKGNIDKRHHINNSLYDLMRKLLYAEPITLTDKAMLKAIGIMEKEELPKRKKK